MTATATAQDSTLGLSFAAYTINTNLQSVILEVVACIISQDSSDRGAWIAVIARRISLAGTYTVHEVEREISRMLRSGALYESAREIRNGNFTMIYVTTGEAEEQ